MLYDKDRFYTLEGSVLMGCFFLGEGGVLCVAYFHFFLSTDTSELDLWPYELCKQYSIIYLMSYSVYYDFKALLVMFVDP